MEHDKPDNLHSADRNSTPGTGSGESGFGSALAAVDGSVADHRTPPVAGSAAAD